MNDNEIKTSQLLSKNLEEAEKIIGDTMRYHRISGMASGLWRGFILGSVCTCLLFLAALLLKHFL